MKIMNQESDPWGEEKLDCLNPWQSEKNMTYGAYSNIGFGKYVESTVLNLQPSTKCSNR
jgi:hypothetical protein